jgi:CheY-specific phosphatase CheX
MLDANEEISPDDTADAIGEIANMIGGGIKRRMIEADPSMKLGLPVFVSGSVVDGSHLDAWSAALAMADVTVHLVVLRHVARAGAEDLCSS